MTKYEAIVVSAYTGFLMCDFGDMHEYIEKKLAVRFGHMNLRTKTYGMKSERRLGPIF